MSALGKRLDALEAAAGDPATDYDHVIICGDEPEAELLAERGIEPGANVLFIRLEDGVRDVEA